MLFITNQEYEELDAEWKRIPDIQNIVDKIKLMTFTKL